MVLIFRKNFGLASEAWDHADDCRCFRWTKSCEDGSNFTFYVRCFNVEEDVPLIRQMTGGKRLLLISDIRGVALTDEEHFDKAKDQELQWQAIQALQPESSLAPLPETYVQGEGRGARKL